MSTAAVAAHTQPACNIYTTTHAAIPDKTINKCGELQSAAMTKTAPTIPVCYSLYFAIEE